MLSREIIGLVFITRKGAIVTYHTLSSFMIINENHVTKLLWLTDCSVPYAVKNKPMEVM